MKKLLTSGVVVFAGMVSLPMAMSPQLSDAPSADYRKDPRLQTLRDFFAKLDCPAWQYATTFLEAADDYALDWRLLPSLSWVESSGGKAARGNNLFGWDSGKAQFSSPRAAIHYIGFQLSHSRIYRNKSLDAVLKTYNPNGAYASRVKAVMQQIAPTE